MGLAEQKELESRYLMGTYARKPVMLKYGQGSYVFDDAGKKYIDFISGVGAVSLGHCHPAVVDAVDSQAIRLIHVSNHYYIENRGEVAELLSGLLNDRIPEEDHLVWQSFFANSGAEANECAIKLARLWAKRNGRPEARTIATLRRSFHGRTLATLAATAQSAKQDVFQPLPEGFVHTPINDIEALEALFAECGSSICAVMIECIQGESGVHPCSQEFVEAARRICTENKALLICDEIQCGMFRCGTYPFGFQHYNVVPDIVTIAKGVASGVPTGMCSARSDVAQAFEPGDHGSTFGGSCLAVAAAKATIETMLSEEIAQKVEEVGAYLRERLAELPHVVEVRGLGLMVACEFDESVNAPELTLRGLEEGLLLNSTNATTLRFLPPLVCGREEVDQLIERLGRLLS